MIGCEFENGNKALLRHCTADVIVLNPNKTKILLVLRAKRLLEGGKWALVGGFMDRDETMEQAAKREVLEETGYELSQIDFLKFNDNPIRPGEDRQNVTFIYKATAGQKTGQPDGESDEIKWFELSKLPTEDRFAFDHYHLIIDHLLS